jgi:predicted site-specific integrase-resolvase
MEKNMLKTEDAARLLGKAPQTIYNWSCMGKIPHTKSGGNLLFRECQLMCMIAMGSK